MASEGGGRLLNPLVGLWRTRRIHIDEQFVQYINYEDNLNVPSLSWECYRGNRDPCITHNGRHTCLFGHFQSSIYIEIWLMNHGLVLQRHAVMTESKAKIYEKNREYDALLSVHFSLICFSPTQESTHSLTKLQPFSSYISCTPWYWCHN